MRIVPLTRRIRYEIYGSSQIVVDIDHNEDMVIKIINHIQRKAIFYYYLNTSKSSSFTYHYAERQKRMDV